MNPWHINPDVGGQAATQEGKRPSVENASADGGSGKPGACWRWCRGSWEQGCLSIKVPRHPLTLLARYFATLAGLWFNPTERGGELVRRFPYAIASLASRVVPGFLQVVLGGCRLASNSQVRLNLLSRSIFQWRCKFPLQTAKWALQQLLAQKSTPKCILCAGKGGGVKRWTKQLRIMACR